MKRKTQARQKVLLLGDWFVDDHWVVGTHRSSTSSRTGKIHLSSLQGVDSATESLCGAGRTASVLHGAKFSILGVGACSKADERVLLALLTPRGLPGRNPHTLRRWTDLGKTDSVPRASFVNLGTDGCGTSRAIRLYERSGDRTELIERIDWETGVLGELPLAELQAVVQKNRNEIGAVVIKDLGKGLVTSSTLGVLADDLGGVPWFISTKKWHPDWRKVLGGVSIRLLLVPEMAARAALGERLDHKSDVERRLTAWMVRGRRPSKGCLAMVQNQLLKWLEPGSGERVEPEVVVVVPDERTVLAFRQDGEAYLSARAPEDDAIPLPMSSVLLGSLTVRLLTGDGGDFPGMIRGAVAFTDEWRRFEGQRISSYDDWNPEAEPKDDVQHRPEPTSDERAFDWIEAHQQWLDCFQPEKRGVVVRDAGPQLELWRSMTELDDFVCIVRAKRKAVARLVDMVRSFSAGKGATQESCLITAQPGAGKTHLVNCLAKLGNLRPIEFNLTHLFEPRDVVDCFERIAVAQAERTDQRLLVFFDEINNPVGGSLMYGSFLTVLERGVYQVSGKAFHLKPALWIFAGTEFDESDVASKAPDLKSRLSRGVINLRPPTQDPESGAPALERVYVGALLLKRQFREIEWIKEDVLDVFKRMPDDTSVRKIRDLVSRFSDVKHRTVDAGCIPWSWLRENVSGIRRRDWAERWKHHEGGPDSVQLVLTAE